MYSPANQGGRKKLEFLLITARGAGGLGGKFRRTNHQIIQQSRADMIKPYQVSMSMRLCQYGKHLNVTISDTMHKSNCIVTIDAYDLS